MLRYAITDGALGDSAKTLSQQYASLTRSGPKELQRDRLLEQVRRLAFHGIDFVQLREKNLPPGELADVARDVLAAIRETGMGLRLLVNTRVDVAIAAGAHGVHLGGTPGEMTPRQVRMVFGSAGLEPPVVSKACHTSVEARDARKAGCDVILFSPVFGKWEDEVEVVAGSGLEGLARACEAAKGVSVLALGGVTAINARDCVEAGAAGIAGIRLFAE